MKKSIQYTVRDVSPELDHVVRERASREGKSINKLLLEAVERGLGYRPEPLRFTDLDHLRGSWVEDPEDDKVLEDFGTVDAGDWS